MEAILILALLFWAFQSYARKAKQMKGNAPAGKAGQAAPQAQHARRHKEVKEPPKAEQAQRQRPVVAQPRAYQTIQPRVKETSNLHDYVGSLGVSSMEGEDTCDPTLEHERETDAYAVENMRGTAEPAARLFPEEWNADALLQGVVMSEILTPPRQRWRKM